jgi:hypothetical protein
MNLIILSRRRFIKTAIKLAVAAVFTRSHASLAQSPNTEAIQDVLTGRRDVANAAWWGDDTSSATDALQGAIRSGAKKVFVPNMGSPWIIDPIYLESNQEIEFEKGVVLLARKGAFLGKGDCLMKAVNKENITLRGVDVVFKMRREDYKQWPYKKAEWRQCLSLCGCKNINIIGLQLEESGGDGLYIGRGIGKESRRYCENIKIKNVICHKNYRQGISVISVRNLLVDKCVLNHTEGTNPQAGLDFEPNNPDELLQNCILRDTVIESNKGYGLLFALGNLNKNSAPISVTIKRCHIRNNVKSALLLAHHDSKNSPIGYIKFSDNIINGSCTVNHTPGIEIIL